MACPKVGNAIGHLLTKILLPAIGLPFQVPPDQGVCYTWCAASLYQFAQPMDTLCTVNVWTQSLNTSLVLQRYLMFKKLVLQKKEGFGNFLFHKMQCNTLHCTQESAALSTIIGIGCREGKQDTHVRLGTNPSQRFSQIFSFFLQLSLSLCKARCIVHFSGAQCEKSVSLSTEGPPQVS